MSTRIKKLVPCFQFQADNLINQILKRIKNEEYVQMEQLFSKMTFDVIGKAGFSFDFELLKSTTTKKEATNFQTVISGLLRPFTVFFPFIQKLPTEFNKKLDKSLEETLSFFNKIIEDRKKLYQKKELNETREKDLLDFILESGNESSTELSTKEIQNNMFLFFLAGQDTTSSLLTNLTYLLAKNPKILEKAREEVDDVLKKEVPNSENTKQLVYCNAIIKETLRLMPPVSAVTARVAKKDVFLSDYLIKKGTVVSVEQTVCHFDENFWETPFQFCPERFLDEKSLNSQQKAYFPFSFGPRVCLGIKFALLETIITFSKMLQTFSSWELSPNYVYKNRIISVSLLPSNGLPIKFHKRS